MLFADWDPATFTFPGFEQVHAKHLTVTMMTNQEALFLAYLATKIPECGAVVEIGSRTGKSTSYLAQALKNQGRGPLYAIDLWDQGPARYARSGSFEQFQSTLAELGLEDVVTPLKGDSSRIGSEWTEPIALLFIDGDHSYEGALADYERFAPHVVDGGLIAFHDACHRNFPDVRRVIEEVVMPGGLWTDMYQLHDRGCIWCARRRVGRVTT